MRNGEAKQGWIVPGETQLGAYAPRLVAAQDAGFETRLVTLSDSTAVWAREVLPSHMAGVEVRHWSWDDVRDLIREARSQVRGTEGVWLDQLEDYMGTATSKRPVTDALAYCVVISNSLFGDATFRDYVATSGSTSTRSSVADGPPSPRTSSRFAGTVLFVRSTESSTTK